MKTTNVGLAEWRVSRNPNERLMAIGLGSCVAIFAYDPSTRIAGAAHMMLPSGRDGGTMPAKYTDSGVPLIVDEMLKAGAHPERLRVGVFGGATLLTQGHSALLDIGPRNVAALQAAIEREGLQPAMVDTGGTKGRTVSINVATGDVTVQILGQPDRVYAELAISPEVSS